MLRSPQAFIQQRYGATWLGWYLFLLVIYHDIVRFHIPVHDSLAVAVIQSLVGKKAEKSKQTLCHPQGKHIFIICDTF